MDQLRNKVPSRRIARKVLTFAFTLLTLLPIFCTHGYAAPARAQETITGVASVIDGDTIEIHGKRLRLHGIDAPESRQLCQNANGTDYRCGQKAALALSDFAGTSPLTCTVHEYDRYGRGIAICSKGTVSINQWMIRQGHALAYIQYSADYVQDEVFAQKENSGIWSGTFQKPWEWRSQQRRR